MKGKQHCFIYSTNVTLIICRDHITPFGSIGVYTGNAGPEKEIHPGWNPSPLQDTILTNIHILIHT